MTSPIATVYALVLHVAALVSIVLLLILGHLSDPLVTTLVGLLGALIGSGAGAGLALLQPATPPVVAVSSPPVPAPPPPAVVPVVVPPVSAMAPRPEAAA